MSKHLFYTTYKRNPVYVLLGWDKSMQGYFMVIDYLNSYKPSPLFSHASLKEPYPNSIDHFLHVLKRELRLFVPNQMIIEVIQDAKSETDIDTKEVIHALIDGCHQREEGIIEMLNGAVVRIKAPKIQNRMMDIHAN